MLLKLFSFHQVASRQFNFDTVYLVIYACAMHQTAACILNIIRTCVLLSKAINHGTDITCAGFSVWDVGCGQLPSS